MRVNYGKVKSSEGRLGLVSSFKIILQAENTAPSHFNSHTSTNHSTPLPFASLDERYCIHASILL